MSPTAYADIEKYMERQTEIGADEAKKLLEKAEEAVELMTRFAVSRRGFENLSVGEKAFVEKAVYAQADHMLENGGDIENNGGEPVSVTIGSFSYSYGSSAAANNAASTCRFSSVALGYLEAAGLLSRRIGVI